MQLANSLQGIVTQTLMPKADGTGRVCALEILFLDDAIRNLIRQGKIEQIYSYMQTGTRRGMQTMEQSLTDLVQRRLIGVNDAIGRSSRPEALSPLSSAPASPFPPLPTGRPQRRRRDPQDGRIVSERHYRIDLVAGVAMPETGPMPIDTGYAETETSTSPRSSSCRRRRLFGFARALELELERDLEPEVLHTRFRTEVRFRRTFNDTFVAPAVALRRRRRPPIPAWRTEFVFRRAPGGELAPVEETAVVADPMTVTEPSSIARSDRRRRRRRARAPRRPRSPDDVETTWSRRSRWSSPTPSPSRARPSPRSPSSKSRSAAPRTPRRRSRSARAAVAARRRAAGPRRPQGRRLAARGRRRRERRRPELDQLARTPFEAGVVVDGEVRDEEALAAALKDFFAQAELPTRDVRIGLSSNRIGVRTLDIAGIDDMERFDNAVRFKAHEVLPIAMNESVLDYRVLGERVDENGEPPSACCSSSPRATRSTRTSRVPQGRRPPRRHRPRGIRAAPHLRRAAPSGDAAEQAAIVVVSIGHESTTLVVSGRRRLRVHPRLRLGRRAARRRHRRRLPARRARGLRDQDAAVARRRAARGHRPRRRGEGAGGGSHGADALRARARLLAPVLPEAAGFAGHRRDRRHRRHLAARRPGRLAAHARRRAGPHSAIRWPRRRRARRRVRPDARRHARLAVRRRSASASTTTRFARSTCCRPTPTPTASAEPQPAPRPGRADRPCRRPRRAARSGPLVGPNREAQLRRAEGRARDAAAALRPGHRLRASRASRPAAPPSSPTCSRRTRLGPRPPRPLARPPGRRLADHGRGRSPAADERPGRPGGLGSSARRRRRPPPSRRPASPSPAGRTTRPASPAARPPRARADPQRRPARQQLDGREGQEERHRVRDRRQLARRRGGLVNEKLKNPKVAIGAAVAGGSPARSSPAGCCSSRRSARRRPSCRRRSTPWQAEIAARKAASPASRRSRSTSARATSSA